MPIIIRTLTVNAFIISVFSQKINSIVKIYLFFYSYIKKMFNFVGDNFTVFA